MVSSHDPHTVTDFHDIISGEPDVKEAVTRVLSATMASTSGNQGEELTKGMVSVVEYMLKMRDREALIDKAVDRTVENVDDLVARTSPIFLLHIETRCNKGISKT